MARAERKILDKIPPLSMSESDVLLKNSHRSTVTLCRRTPTRGRPKLCNSDFIPRTAHVLCSQHGFTLKELAGVFNVALITVKVWMQKHEEFNHAVKSGRDRFDSEVVEKALLKAALGYEYEETVVRNWVDKNGNRKVDTIIFTKYAPPNVKAILFWLNNRKPDRWNNETSPVKSYFDYVNSVKIVDLSKLDDFQMNSLQGMVTITESP